MIENESCSTTSVDPKTVFETQIEPENVPLGPQNILNHNLDPMKAQFLPYSMLTYLNPNSTQPQLKFNKTSTQPHTNLTSMSASNQPQPQYQPQLILKLKLNLIWL